MIAKDLNFNHFFIAKKKRFKHILTNLVNKEVQEKVFSIIGYDDNQVNERFGPLLESFDYGAPPHGGMGLGIDRLISTFLDEDSIRDVISFPKTQSASDLLWGAPSIIDNEQKLELRIKNIEDEKGIK